MSRRSRRRRTNDSPLPSAYRPPRSLTPLLRELASPWEPDRLIEDRRTYHPLGFFRPAMVHPGGPAGPVTVKTPLNKNKPFLAHGLGFSAPKKTLICIRRGQRKEVLHALKKTGKGKGGGRKRRNWYSNIGC